MSSVQLQPVRMRIDTPPKAKFTEDEMKWCVQGNNLSKSIVKRLISCHNMRIMNPMCPDARLDFEMLLKQWRGLSDYPFRTRNR